MERTWIVVGENVGLTAMVREEFVARWDRYNDPELTTLLAYPAASESPGSPAKPPVTRENREGLWELIVSRGVLAFDIRAADDQRLLGECSLSRILWPRGSAEVAVALFDAADRGRGLGTEAVALMMAYGFDGYGLHRVSMRYLAANDAAVNACARAVENLGGRIVGVEREAEWAFGGWQDCVIMEVLASDFPPQAATAHLREAPSRFELPG